MTGAEIEGEVEASHGRCEARQGLAGYGGEGRQAARQDKAGGKASEVTN